MQTQEEIITAIQRLPLTDQIDIMYKIAQGRDFGTITDHLAHELEHVLQRMKCDAYDAAVMEQTRLHGHEVGHLTLVYNRDGGVWA